MSKEDIEKAVNEAAKFAEEDKKAKEAVDVKNNAEHMVFQCEKTLGELGDKIDAGEKASVQGAIDKLKETIKTNNTEAIKADTEALQQAFYAVSEKLYKQQAPEGDMGAQGGTQGADGTYYNTDFEDKTDK